MAGQSAAAVHGPCSRRPVTPQVALRGEKEQVGQLRISTATTTTTTATTIAIATITTATTAR